MSLSQGLCLRGWRLYGFGGEEESMLTDTRNEARLVFPQRGWGPKYPSSRGLILTLLLQFAYLDQSSAMPKRLPLISCNI